MSHTCHALWRLWWGQSRCCSALRARFNSVCSVSRSDRDATSYKIKKAFNIREANMYQLKECMHVFTCTCCWLFPPMMVLSLLGREETLHSLSPGWDAWSRVRGSRLSPLWDKCWCSSCKEPQNQTEAYNVTQPQNSCYVCLESLIFDCLMLYSHFLINLMNPC